MFQTPPYFSCFCNFFLFVRTPDISTFYSLLSLCDLAWWSLTFPSFLHRSKQPHKHHDQHCISPLAPPPCYHSSQSHESRRSLLSTVLIQSWNALGIQLLVWTIPFHFHRQLFLFTFLSLFALLSSHLFAVLNLSLLHIVS